MSTTVDASVMRNVNKRIVLGLLYLEHTISRADISRATGLNRATVSSLVDELIAERYVTEVGMGTSSGGRKPIMLQFNANTGYVIGLDVQITHITTVVINAAREVIMEKRRDVSPADQPLGDTVLIRVLLDEIQRAKMHCPDSPHGIMGIGIGLPGLVNHQEGRALYLPNLGITNWNLRELLGAHESLPIFIDNDANCGAWSEYLTTRIPNLIFINAGIGLGAGIIINGQLYRGADGLAGEAGHHAVRDTGRDCSCGSVGCWEQYASERSLARHLRAAGAKVEVPLPPNFIEESVARARLGEAIFENAFQELGQHLGIGLVNLLNLLNPDTVYLGGTIGEAADVLFPHIQDIIATRALMNNRAVKLSSSPLSSVALGAAGLALAQSIDLLPTPTI